MKRVLFFLFLFCGAAAPLKVSVLSLDEVIARLSTPDDVVRFMQNNFSLEEDAALFGAADYWQRPEDFWQLRAGDCEDYALFAKYALDRHGFESYVVSFYGPRNFAHTVVVFKDRGGYHVIDEDRLHELEFPTIEDALTWIEPDWTWGGIAEERDARGWMVQEIKRRK